MSSGNETSKQSCYNESGNGGETPLLENLPKPNNISTSVLFESNSPYFTTNKAVFTIHFSSSQILVVNSVTCQLVHYNSDELCSMKLEALIHDSYKQRWLNLKRDFSQNSPQISCSNEKLIELVTKNDDTIVTSLYLKQLDCPQKCLVVAEPIDRRQGMISIDCHGKILSLDEEVALLFQYDASKLIGVHVSTLLPSLHLKTLTETHDRVTYKQYATGRSKNRVAFPVCLTINWGHSNSEVIQILVWAYPTVSGLLVLNEKLLLRNCTHYFVKLLFGRSRKKVTNEPITSLIPSFCNNVKLEGERHQLQQQQQQQQQPPNEPPNIYEGCDGDGADLTDNIIKINFLMEYKSDSKSSSLSSTMNSENVDEPNEADDMNAFKTLFSCSSKQGKCLNQNSFECLDDSNSDSCGGIEENYRCVVEGKEAVDINTFSEYFAATGARFTGYGKHVDGSNISIKYQVKRVTMTDEVYYCVWVFSDWVNYLHLKNTSNISRSSSLNSTSIESFFTKDSTFSESWTKPGNISLISQSDEVLTVGEYSKHYTNVMEIGKGAFGYVKMAFRNSDGLLVVTKFIKKQKVNISSWVHQPDLNMKIPLEISLLTTLDHPNIVRVLDVFHNDCFVQLVMEKHGAGFDLFEFIDRGPNYDEKLKSYIFRQIVSAVHYLDSLGILHRDIKDENVIINEKFEVKLIDFGSAAFMPPDESFSKFYGTVEYCSPEVLQGNRYRGPELEIWALGVTLYILTFGENPFYDVEDTVRGQFSIPSPISRDLEDLLRKMLDTNVETRITIDKVSENAWVTQPVAIENYKFEEVVRCHESEAHPPKYVYEINSQDYFSKPDLRIDVTQCSETQYSESSIQSKDLDDTMDGFSDLCKPMKLDSGPQRRDTSPVLMSSTPLKKRNFRLCKSAVGVRKRPDNFSPVNEFTTASCDANWLAKNSNPNLRKLKQLNKSSPNLMTTPNAIRKNTLIAWDDADQELQVRFEKCVFAEAGKPDAKESSKSLNSNSTAGEESGRGEKDSARYLSF